MSVNHKIKRSCIDPEGTSQLVVETSNCLERVTIPNRFIQFDFRPGVYSKGFFERVSDRDWNTLPWYQNPIDHLFVK